MSRIEIEEASNGWVIKAAGESRHEPRVFEYDGNNRYRTSIENIVMTAERALAYVLSEMIGSHHYELKIKEADDVKPATDGDQK